VAQITRKRTGQLLRKLFAILMAHPEGMPARQALDELEAGEVLTDYERGNFPSGARRFPTIVRFYTVNCVKAGWLLKNKGRWSITDEGRAAYNTFRDPEEFSREVSRLYNLSQQSSIPEDATEAVIENEIEASDGAAASINFEQAEEQAWMEIEQYLRAMNPYDFQELVAALLRAMGYHVSWIAPPGKDGGIDILAWSDPLGTRPPRIKVQVKRQVASVNVDGLRSFMALLGDDDVGLFVVLGGFTKDAQDEARTQEKRKVTLIDLEQLFDLWVEYYRKLDDEARRRLPLRPIHFLAPET
jgi:restriction system protein